MLSMCEQTIRWMWNRMCVFQLVWFIRVFSFSSSFIDALLFRLLYRRFVAIAVDICRLSMQKSLPSLSSSIERLWRWLELRTTEILWMPFVYHTCKYVVCLRAHFPCHLCMNELNNIRYLISKHNDIYIDMAWHVWCGMMYYMCCDLK